MSTNKVIVSNRGALQAKYRTKFPAVEAAIKALMAADARRGLSSLCIWIDDAAEMQKYGGVPPVNVNDQRGNKQAVDAIFETLAPDYLVLLDGPDVIPHIALNNPMPNDEDATVDSDLPYAVSDKFSPDVTRNLKVTRVVGRIPNSPGEKEPDGLLTLLDVAANAEPHDESRYRSYFGLSAKVWTASTRMSLNAIFGSHAGLQVSPPDGPPGTDVWLRKPSHFINCHGSTLSPEFTGQDGSSYPIAMTSDQVSRNAEPGTVAAAECCYGAQLYDPDLADVADPICMAYLLKGGLGFLGSTTIAYGPANSNGQADLICQYFFEEMLGGASLGRALLQARLRFISSQRLSDPSNLKTIAQFLLLGDPSVTPCKAKTIVLAALRNVALDAEAERKSRRADLAAAGMSLAEGKSVPVGPGEVPSQVKERIRAIAKEHGFGEAREAVLAISGPANYLAAAKERAVNERVMIVSEQSKIKDTRIVVIRHLIAHIIGNGIGSVDIIESR